METDDKIEGFPKGIENESNLVLLTTDYFLTFVSYCCDPFPPLHRPRQTWFEQLVDSHFRKADLRC